MIKYRKLKNLLIWKCKQKKVGSQLPTATRMAELEEVEPPVPLVLLPCTSCTRTFRAEALAKHAKVCEKTLMKKRKKFDSAKQRLQGTDVPVFPPPTKQHKETPYKSIAQSKWREKQAELAKGLNSVRKKSDSSPVKPSDHEQCIYCERYFGPKAYDRHTEWCKEQHTKLKNSSNVNQEAKERLQVRTKYRAPLSNKVLTRDKYLPRSRDPSPMSLSRTEGDESTKHKLPSPGPLNRTASLRMNGRSKSMLHRSPSIPPAELRDAKLRAPASSVSIRREIQPKETERASVTHAEPTKPKIVSSSQSTKKDVNKYDPFASAEQQMLELFGNSQPSAQQLTNSTSSPEDESKDPETPSSPVDPPSSAFAIYTPKPRRLSSTESVKSDNKENNNVDSDGTMSPPPSEQIDNRKNFSLSNLSLCSIISIDSVDCNRNPVGVKTFRVRDEPMQRSFSAVEGKHGRGRVKVNMQQMLYGFDSPERPTSPAKSVDAGNLEACEAELIVSMMEFEKMLNNSPIPNIDPFPVSPTPSKPSNSGQKSPDEEREPRTAVPASIDSAYSSLTRAPSGDGDVTKDPPKFCHECGTKYPVAVAKFCCNCGIRRITI